MAQQTITDPRFPQRLVIVAGTYDGVLAGWDTVEHVREQDKNDIELKLLRRNDGAHLKLSFAMAAHEGSVRCLDISTATSPLMPVKHGDSAEEKNTETKKKRKRADKSKNNKDDKEVEQSDVTPEPGSLLSGGFDETINVFNLQKHNQTGELKTPNDLGSPLCCSFAPPSSSSTSPSTHALVGLTSGKVVLYKKRDWSVQHVLSGHDDGGVQCLAVHPTGRMALTGGRDGKIILWDLMKGRLAFVHKLPSRGKGKGRKETVNHIIWSDDGNRYAFCYGTKITARDVTSGEDLLDVDLPGRVNQLAFIGGPEGLFVAAACDDGGLPVLEVGQLEEEEDANTRRAIMAIEPVEKVVAGDDRLKCIKSVAGGSGFLVVIANSGGVVSLLDLEGAARMMLIDSGDGGREDDDDDDIGPNSDSEESESDADSDEEIEAAVEFLDSVRIGSGARITSLNVWSHGGDGGLETVEDFDGDEDENLSHDDGNVLEAEEEDKKKESNDNSNSNKGTEGKDNVSNKIELDSEAVEKARKLVGQAKKHQKKQKKKLEKKSKKQ